MQPIFRSMPLVALGLAFIGCRESGTAITEHHEGAWEKVIGYSQSVRAGKRVLVSGTIGASAEAKDMASQMATAYKRIQQTLLQHHLDLGHVVRETIYTRDMEALIKCQEIRKSLYRGHAPAATWVQVQRLYVPEALLEIEVEAVE